MNEIKEEAGKRATEAKLGNKRERNEEEKSKKLD